MRNEEYLSGFGFEVLAVGADGFCSSEYHYFSEFWQSCVVLCGDVGEELPDPQCRVVS